PPLPPLSPYTTLFRSLAVVIDRALIRFLPSGHTPLSLSPTPNWAALGFTFLVSLLAGMLFGLVPALQTTRPGLAGTLKDQAAGVDRKSTRLNSSHGSI